MQTPDDTVKSQLLDAALVHVAFDGWSEETFRAAIRDSEVDPAVARMACPKGALDLAIAFHEAGDAAMVKALEERDMADMRFRDKIALAVRLRLELIGDKEAVRRGTTLFALPHNAAEGAKLIWGTADAIWTALGDSSVDVNWYTKRATLSAVYSSTVLYWLGDDSMDHEATWAFLDRRIENVMQFEKLKAQVNGNPVLSRLMTGPNWMLSRIKAPSENRGMGLPGSFGNR